MPSNKKQIAINFSLLSQYSLVGNKKAGFLGLMVFLLLGTALRLLDLDSQSVWFDEAARLLIARAPVKTIIQTTGGDTLPPLYHLLLHYWQLLGTQDFWTRLPSVFANVIFIAAIFQLGRTLFNEQVGLLAAVLVSILPYLVFHAQQANLYSLYLLFAVLQILLFWKIYKQKASIKNYLFYIFVNVGAIYTHHFALVLLVSLHLFLFLQKQINKQIIFADMVILLGYLPYLATFYNKAAEVSSGFWLSKPSLLEPFLTLYLFLGSYTLAGTPYILGLCLVLSLLMLSLLEIKHHRTNLLIENDALQFLLILTFFPILGVWIISQWIPLYLARVLLITLPTYIILLAYALAHTRWRSPLPYVAGLILPLLLISLYNYFQSPDYWKTDYRTAATTIVEFQSSNDAIIHTSNGSYIPFLIYLPSKNHFLLEGDPSPHHPPNVHKNGGGTTIVESELARFDHIILVVALEHSIDYQKNILAHFDNTYTLIESLSVDGIIIHIYNIKS